MHFEEHLGVRDSSTTLPLHLPTSLRIQSNLDFLHSMLKDNQKEMYRAL